MEDATKPAVRLYVPDADVIETQAYLFERSRQRVLGHHDGQDYQDLPDMDDVMLWDVTDEREAKARVEQMETKGRLTWAHILHEEYVEALNAEDDGSRYAELVQVAAVALRWAGAIRRRKAVTP